MFFGGWGRLHGGKLRRVCWCGSGGSLAVGRLQIPSPEHRPAERRTHISGSCRYPLPHLLGPRILGPKRHQLRVTTTCLDFLPSLEARRPARASLGWRPGVQGWVLLEAPGENAFLPSSSFWRPRTSLGASPHAPLPTSPRFLLLVPRPVALSSLLRKDTLLPVRVPSPPQGPPSLPPAKSLPSHQEVLTGPRSQDVDITRRHQPPPPPQSNGQTNADI